MPASERLDSWKEIAAYLKRDVRTVHRWEHTEGLPVHRHPHQKRGSVYAFKPELDVWWNDGHGRLEREAEGGHKKALGLRYIVAVGGVIVVATLAYFLVRPLPVPRVLGSTQITTDGLKKSCLVTDGSRLYFCELAGTNSVLAQVSVRGGEVVRIPTPFPEVEALGVDPDHGELLVANHGLEAAHQKLQTDEGPLWVVPALGGAARRVGEVIHHGATWSPDGRSIVYANGHDLYIAHSDGTDVRRLLAVPGLPYRPRWSPDGKLLRFSLHDSKTNTSSLWQVQGDGSGLRPLLPGWKQPSAECCGNWTPDGRSFVFQSSHDGRTDIWAIREKSGLHRPSTEPVQLTSGPIDFLDPLPSADGKELFVVGSQPRGELVRYDLKAQRFLAYLSGISAEGLDFTRDGAWAAYVTIPGSVLFRSRVDGTQRVQLTFPPMQAFQPRWSPDGKRIAFEARTPGKPWKIFLVSAEGGSLQQLTTGDENDADVGWSPDGKSLVFGGKPWVEKLPPASTAVHLLDLESHQISTLPGSEAIWSPSWSPDGRYIAGTSLDTSASATGDGIVVFDFRTQKWTGLLKAKVGFLNWSRDGRYIYFDSPFGDKPAFYRVSVGDGKLEPLIDLRDFRRAPGLWETWAGLAPDDSPLLVRDAGLEDIYALDWREQ